MLNRGSMPPMESSSLASQSIKLKLLHARPIPTWGFKRRARTHAIRIKCCSCSSEDSDKDKKFVRISGIVTTLTIVSLGLPQPPAALAELKSKTKAAEKKKRNVMTTDERNKWTENLPSVEEKVPYSDILELKSQGKLKYIIKHPKAAVGKRPEVILLVLEDDRVVRTVLPSPYRDEKFWKDWDELGLDSTIMRAYTPPSPKIRLPDNSYMFELAYILWNLGLYCFGTGVFRPQKVKKKEKIIVVEEEKEEEEEEEEEEEVEEEDEEQEEDIDEDPLLAHIRREKLELKRRDEELKISLEEQAKEKKNQKELEKKRRREEDKIRMKQKEEEERLRELETAKITEAEMGKIYYEMAHSQETRFFMGIAFFVLFYFTAVRSYKVKRKDYEDRQRMLEVEDEEKSKLRELEDDEMEGDTGVTEEDMELLEAVEKNPQLQAGLQFLKSGARMKRAGGRGKGRRRRPPQYMEASVDVKFEDVAGMGTIRRELEEIVEFFKFRERYLRRGSKIPSGILLSGEPGTGKTLLAKAVAGEAGVNFFSISASQFVEIFVGVGAARVRTLYQEARDNAPAVVFIDELDAVGRTRGLVSGSGGQERDATVNQLLTCLDGFEGKGEVITIAATNRPDVLDPALVRPGRFDRKIQIPRPELEGRIEILKVHCRKKRMADDVDYEAVGRATAGMVGAQIANIVDRASLYVRRDGRSEITTDDLLEAVEGEEGGVHVEQEHCMDIWRRIAMNEAAQAVASVNFPDLKNINMVTISPRAGELKGRTRFTMDSTKFWLPSVSRRMMLDHITVQLAPRAADEIWNGPDQMCTIWADTVDNARRVAREFVFAGLSDNKDLYGVADCWYEADRINEVDVEALRILNMCYEHAKKILQRNCRLVDVLVDELLAKKTLDKHEFFELVDAYGHFDPVPSQPMDIRNIRLAEYREKMKDKRILTPK